MIQVTRRIGWAESLILFGIPTIMLYSACYVLLPELVRSFSLLPNIAWFISGGIVFFVLFSSAIFLTRVETKSSSIVALMKDLNIKTMSRRDWKLSLLAVVVIFVLTGLVFYFITLLDPNFKSLPPFLAVYGEQHSEPWVLIPWLIMFFFNIIGEEIMWRGFILQRQELVFENKAWLINASFWMLFHLSFGWQMMIVLIPIIFIQPYIYHLTKNTSTGIVIHGLINGPTFVLITLLG